MIIEQSKCTGCMACKNACPRNAIKIIEVDGFRYPEIIEEYCVNCKLCENACPIINKKDEQIKDVHAYACKNSNEKIRMESSSGGVFTLIATYIINNGGVVYGVAFNNKFKTEHIKVDSITDLKKIRGSKYIQSNIGSIFKDVKKDLESGKKVLFTGTPCQVEGIQSYLGKEYSNLFLQDIICHGVPSEKIFEKYFNNKEKELGKITQFSFRNKKNKGWNKYQLYIVSENGEEYIDHSLDSYMNFFLTDIALRESCYECNFKKKYRESDITLADFWGIEEVCSEMNDEKGTSLVIVNSTKGKELFDNISDSIEKKEVNFFDAINHNKSMTQSPKYHSKRKELFEDLEKSSYDELVKKYLN